MKFEEALRKILENQSRTMKRKLWGNGSTYNYLWMTSVNTLVASVGDGNSCPPLMEFSDYLADDWEVNPK